MILWNGNFSFPCGTTLSPFPVNFQRITTQQQRHPFCLIRSSTPTLTVLLRTKKRIPKPAWHPHSSPETCASYGRTGSVLSQPYQKHQQSPERVVILYSAKLLFSHFSARSRRTFPYVRKYISRYFREHFQLTLSQYITYLRLSHAKHLLETTSLSITETALQSGFPNVSYFIRTFKNTFHVPPLQYRNSIR